MRSPPWKVGELARLTGLTVRTLHHYHAIGLLVPSHQSGAGHRLYAVRDAERLQQIVSLRQLGFSLEEVRACLAGDEFPPLRVVELHLAQLREQLAQRQRLVGRLEALADRFRAAEAVSAEELVGAIEEMTMFEKYYTPEQMEQLKARGEQVGAARIQEVVAEWPQLMAAVQAEMDQGTDPADPKVQELARRWQGLIHEFTGGDPGIAQSLKTMYQNEPVVHGQATAPMRAMAEYVRKALKAAKGE